MRLGSSRDGSLSLPPRPYLPPTAAGAAGVSVAAAFVLELAWGLRVDDGFGFKLELAWILAGIGIVVSVATITVMCFARGPRGAWCRWLVVGLMMGFCSASVWMFVWSLHAERLALASCGDTTIEICGDAAAGQFGFAASARIRGQDGSLIARVRCSTQEEVAAGSVMRCVYRVKPFDESPWSRSRFMKGECASVQVVHIDDADYAGGGGCIARVRRTLLRAIASQDDEARALIAGVVCGRTTELDATEANEAFSVCGLTHLVAVSGSHLAYIAVILQTVLARTRAGRFVRASVLLACMCIYVAFSGGAPSAIRSVVMVSLSFGTVALGRRSHALSGWSLAVLLLVVCDPGIVFDLGFQLSAASVLFILLFGTYAGYILGRLGLPRILAEPLAMTLVAQWATIPLTLPTFGTVSLVSPLANLLVGPPMTALLSVGLIAVPLGAFTPLGQLALMPAVALARISIFGARVCAAVPYASINVVASAIVAVLPYIAAVLLYLNWPDASVAKVGAFLCALVVLAACWLVYWGRFAPPSITVMDIGQGDSILIRDGPSTLLVDGGIDDATSAALARNHVFRLDGVAVTHWDRDHWGGLPGVFKTVPVSSVLVARGASKNAPEEFDGRRRGDICELEEGDRVRVGGFTCTVVWPREVVDGEENGDSLCMLVEYDRGGRRMSMLLTGDAERDEIGACCREVGDIDVLKVGHHGSKISVTGEIMDVLKPEVSIASAGEGNRYGHPSRECIEQIERGGSHFLCTKDVGDIVVEPGAHGARVTAAHPGG